jgi:hypothetical protein
MDRSALRLFPSQCCSGFQWLYAIGYSDGTVKIGLTCLPRRRMDEHWRRSGGSFAWAHVFPKIGDRLARSAERLALNAVAANARRAGGTELFRDLTRADALRLVRAAISEAA